MISVIIPTYNRANTIGRSIRSVLSQTYQDIELIVVDDCSTDNTYEVIRSIGDNRLSYVKLDKNSGACVARNKGIELAKGEYIAFQDSDDEWYPEKLEKQLAALIKNDADVCFCQTRIYNVGGERSFVFPSEKEMNGYVTLKTLYSRGGITTQTILSKKKVCDKCHFDPLVTKLQDYDWGIQAGQEFSFYFLAEPLVNQYRQNDSISLSKDALQRERAMRQYFYNKYSYRYNEDRYMEYWLLKNMVYMKCLCGENTSKDYQRIYQLSGKKKYLIGALLGDTRLFHLCIKFYNNMKYSKYWR